MDYYTLAFTTVEGIERTHRGVRTDGAICDILSEQNAEEVGKHNMSRSGLGDLLNGSFMPADRTYHEIPGEGAVAVTKAYPLQGYYSEVHLFGFSQQSDLYKKWVSTLEELGFEKQQSPKEEMQQMMDQVEKLKLDAKP